MKACAELLQRLLLVLDSVIVLLEFGVEVGCVLFPLVLDKLTHLKEDRIVLFIKCRFIQTKMFMVKNQSLIFLLNLERQLLAQSLDLSMQLDHDL